MKPPTYMRCRWIHNFADEPVEIWSEVGSDGYEQRKVEVFPDGALGYANDAGSTEATTGTQLSDQKVPSIEEIASDPQFEITQISKSTFEEMWLDRRHK